MNVDTMRWLIMKVYPLGDWQADVEAMPDHQVVATYQRMLSDGKIKIL